MENNVMIEIKNVSKTFQTKEAVVKALEDINLIIQKGDIYGIIGMSGAGKSTLVRCMNFLERPTKGSVIVNGKDLIKLDPLGLRQARRSIGMIFQQFNLLMQRTVEDNIRFPLELSGMPKAESSKRVTHLLELVELTEKAKVYPSQLSGGQKQRVAIARALATNPSVLLCDEATSALDPNTTRSILKLIKDINQKLGITVVIITHEMKVIEEICSHVAIIDSSKICESGTVEEIFTNPKTPAAQRLLFPDGRKIERFVGTRCCRIVFNGNSSFEPVIANMILETKAPVNILFADTKNIEGKAFGQMILQLPEEHDSASKVLRYLKTQNLTVEEVDDYVG